MKLQRPRVTIRRMMIACAVVGSCLGAARAAGWFRETPHVEIIEVTNCDGFLSDTDSACMLSSSRSAELIEASPARIETRLGAIADRAIRDLVGPSEPEMLRKDRGDGRAQRLR